MLTDIASDNKENYKVLKTSGYNANSFHITFSKFAFGDRGVCEKTQPKYLLTPSCQVHCIEYPPFDGNKTYEMLSTT